MSNTLYGLLVAVCITCVCLFAVTCCCIPSCTKPSALRKCILLAKRITSIASCEDSWISSAGTATVKPLPPYQGIRWKNICAGWSPWAAPQQERFRRSFKEQQETEKHQKHRKSNFNFMRHFRIGVWKNSANLFQYFRFGASVKWMPEAFRPQQAALNKAPWCSMIYHDVSWSIMMYHNIVPKNWRTTCQTDLSRCQRNQPRLFQSFHAKYGVSN